MDRFKYKYYDDEDIGLFEDSMDNYKHSKFIGETVVFDLDKSENLIAIEILGFKAGNFPKKDVQKALKKYLGKDSEELFQRIIREREQESLS